MGRRHAAMMVLGLALMVGGPWAQGKERPDVGGQNAGASDETAAPPKDAQWTIYCRSVTGPSHVVQAKEFKKQLQAKTGLKGWYLIHGESESTVYYGYYRTINDPKDEKEVARAKKDMKMVRGVRDDVGDPVFPSSLFVEIDAPDPGGPREWNLMNAPEGAYWSLEIGAYADSPDRKRAAVEAVKEARAQGYDAYYFHGPTISSVCIGAWPRTAVKEQESDAARTGPGEDPDTPLYVLSQPLPEGADPNMRDSEGRQVKVMAPRVEVQDPKLTEMMKRFPTHLVNGMEVRRKYRNPQTGKAEEMPEPSLLVLIPRPELKQQDGAAPETPEGLDPANPAVGLDDPTAPEVAPRRPPAPATPGLGRLRSIGD